ncbi:MAG: hypothetical protein U5O69_01365 [Candidatus Competibacteraceae bacterium]|nr:hypothetical protein [Candidatus Competibacteraceae bacterium]
MTSAAIPGAFPPSMIDVEINGQLYQEMHVDGGASAQVFVYPPSLNLKEMERKTGNQRERRVYVIRNSRLDPDWTQVERSTMTIAGRAISSLIHTQGIGDLYRIYLTTQRDGVDFNLAYIPASFNAPHKEEFDTEFMRQLTPWGTTWRPRAIRGRRHRRVLLLQPPINDLIRQLAQRHFPPVNFPVIQDTGRVSAWCAHQQDQQVKEWAYSLAHARTLAITGKFTGGSVIVPDDRAAGVRLTRQDERKAELCRPGQEPAPRQGIQILAERTSRSAVQDRATPKPLIGSQALLERFDASDIRKRDLGRGLDFQGNQNSILFQDKVYLATGAVPPKIEPAAG